MRLWLAIATAIGILLLAASPAIASPPSAGAEAAKKGKKKSKKCKKGRVKVKFGRRIRCLPLKAALPKPKAVDVRTAIIKEALTPEIGHIPDPTDRLPPPMEKVYRQLGPKALKGMEKMVGIAVNRVDSLSKARVSTSAGAHASAESGGSLHGTFGNVTIDARLSIAVVGAELVGRVDFSVTRDEGGGRTVRVTTQIPIRLKKQGFESPKCPTAEGKLDATDGIGITVRTEVRQGNTLEEFYSSEVVDETEMQGIVADDAKLDTLEIRSIQEIKERAGGSIWGGSEVRGTIVRNTVVDMRTGEYRPTVVPINVGVTLSGVLRIFAPFIQPMVAERLKRAADKDFAATVDYEMKKYRELEEGWNRPNTCAKLAFDRANESLTLSLGESGDETVRVDSTRGGSPQKADWSITSQENGGFSLSNHSVNPTKFHYKVTRAGPDVKLKGTFKAISKAGVAEESWIQKTEQDSINHLIGSFSGEIITPTINGPSVRSWDGSVVLDRTTPDVLGGPNGAFALSEGAVSYHLSGKEGLITGCDWSGTGLADLPVGSASGSASVFGTPPDLTAPYTYNIQIVSPFGANVKFTRSNCPTGAEEWEATEETIPFIVEFDSGSQESADGIVYAGSREESPGEVTIKESWSFQGKQKKP